MRRLLLTTGVVFLGLVVYIAATYHAVPGRTKIVNGHRVVEIRRQPGACPVCDTLKNARRFRIG